ncbi:MAG: hypothetical protein KC777_08820 [Cyanobacteria bacterium HKST-UBA02]|nr:hypothetical protein [Cyanobacteria bacterium HKST-UBA02]
MNEVGNLFICAFWILLVSAFFSALVGRKTPSWTASLGLVAAAFPGMAGAIIGFDKYLSFSAPEPFYLGLAPVAFNVDPLACFFVFLLCLIVVPVAVYAPAYLEQHKSSEGLSGRTFWPSLSIFVLSMGGVILAANSLTFLLFFELMSVSSAILVASDIKALRAARAVIVYLGATRVAVVCLAVGFILFYLQCGDWSFSAIKAGDPACLPAAVLVLAGLAIKAGLWPFHIWLPYAHPEAPAPVSALMSGVMVKVAIYAMIRLFFGSEGASLPVAVILVVLGGVSALWGVLFALVQIDLKRLLAYSTVENVGLIALSLGVALFGKVFGSEAVTAFGFAAALYHCLGHGIFKSLLFLCAGAVDSVMHTRDLHRLSGLKNAMPFTMVCFLTGAIAISALPPLNGFVGKWLLYQGLLQVALGDGGVVAPALALAAIGVLALVGGLALACFSKAFFLVFLGRPRNRAVARARECKTSMIFGQIFLALACLVCAVGSSFIVKSIEKVESVSGLASAATAGLDVPLIICILASACIFIYMMITLGGRKVRNYSTWECGYGALSERMQIADESFVQPVASLFRPVLVYKLAQKIEGRDRRHFPEVVSVETSMQSHLESRFYLPIIHLVEYLSAHLARLQAGSIHLYLLYVLVTLVFLLLLGVYL